MTDNKYVYRTLSERDEVAVKQLIRDVFSRFLRGNYWDWKYSHNPNFDRSMVAVAEKDGKIVGCNHWLIRDLRLSSSLTVKAILCGDIAVDADHRGHGLGKSLLLFLRSTGIFKDKEAVVNYMFANPELSKSLYRPVVGYIQIPTSTIIYTKRLNWKYIAQRASVLNEKVDLSVSANGKINRPPNVITFCVFGAPPLTITIRGGRIIVNEEYVEDADVKVESDIATLVNLQERKNRTIRLLKAILTRKLKIKGKLTGIYRLYKSLNMLEEIFTKSRSYAR